MTEATNNVGLEMGVFIQRKMSFYLDTEKR
jgi:hypothetical protein